MMRAGGGPPQGEGEVSVRKSPRARFANGVVSAIVLCFFTIHALLGTFAPVFSYTSPFRWVVWVGVGIIGVHVVLSIVTSYLQMTDAEFPPSDRKKRHLVLKWVTGLLLVGSVVLHIVCMRFPGLFSGVPFVPRLATVVLAGALAWHACVGMKSMLKDVGLGKRLMTPLRVVVCALAVVFAVMALVS